MPRPTCRAVASPGQQESKGIPLWLPGTPHQLLGTPHRVPERRDCLFSPEQGHVACRRTDTVRRFLLFRSWGGEPTRSFLTHWRGPSRDLGSQACPRGSQPAVAGEAGPVAAGDAFNSVAKQVVRSLAAPFPRAWVSLGSRPCRKTRRDPAFPGKRPQPPVPLAHAGCAPVPASPPSPGSHRLLQVTGTHKAPQEAHVVPLSCSRHGNKNRCFHLPSSPARAPEWAQLSFPDPGLQQRTHRVTGRHRRQGDKSQQLRTAQCTRPLPVDP